jgi:hypothetical protein
MLSKGARLFVLSLVTAAASVAVAGPAPAEVSQTPGATACPAGYPLMSVVAMEATGPYYVPRLVDTGGNDNGLVCAKPQPDSVRDNDCKHGGEVACLLQQLGLPHYLFKDDDSPALRDAA